MPRALFVQYTDPAGYPPIQHAMTMLQRDGWEIASVGTRIKVTSDLRMAPKHNFKSYLMWRVPSGRIAQKIHYCYFFALTAVVSLRWRPDVVYASDMIAAPAALIARWLARSKLVYHEHDSPNAAKGVLARLLWRSRSAICRAALCVITPNVMRSRKLSEQTGVASARVVTVFNCPLQHEILTLSSDEPVRAVSSKFWLYYHGSVVPDRLPLAVIDALALLPPTVFLRIVGYETIGAAGYVETIRHRAREQGVLARLDIVGPVSRFELHQFVRNSHVGLSLMPLKSQDVNMVHMVGASNKPFDYLASGCPIIVSDLRDWRTMFVELGVASSCNPASALSIRDAVNHWLAQPDLYRKARRDGLRRIAEHWNYETQFEPVVAALRTNTKCGTATHIPI